MKVKKLTQMATALVVLLFFSFSAKTAQAQCNDTIATFSSSTVKGYIEFEGVKYTYVSGKKYSTWFYMLNVKSGSGFGKDWSHENFQLGKCMVSSMFDAGGTWTGTFASPTLSTNSCLSIGKDGSDPNNMWGIKYDCGLVNGTYKIWFRLKSDYSVTSNTVKVKAGTPFDSAKICGPDITCGVVPVKMVRFDAKRIYVDGSFYDELIWVTATELNNKEFVVQMSTDSRNWIEVDTVKTKAEGGNSSQLLHYSHRIQRPTQSSEQQAYYRLTQIDFDGTSETSNIIASKLQNNISKKFDFQMYPNPGAKINIALEGSDLLEEKTLEIKNPLGQTLLTRSFVGTVHEITKEEITSMSPGTYYVTISYNGFTKTQKLIVH